jgi:hypothetical protein
MKILILPHPDPHNWFCCESGFEISGPDKDHDSFQENLDKLFNKTQLYIVACYMFFTVHFYRLFYRAITMS